jgi:hypothetical protein
MIIDAMNNTLFEVFLISIQCCRVVKIHTSFENMNSLFQFFRHFTIIHKMNPPKKRWINNSMKTLFVLQLITRLFIHLNNKFLFSFEGVKEALEKNVCTYCYTGENFENQYSYNIYTTHSNWNNKERVSKKTVLFFSQDIWTMQHMMMERFLMQHNTHSLSSYRWSCYTCDLSGDKGICEVCKNICHKEHEISPNFRKDPFFWYHFKRES